VALTRADSYQAGSEEAAGVLGRIPDDAEVAANVRPIAHLTGRCRVFWIGNTDGPVPDYIAYYDPLRDAASLIAYADSLRPGARYEVLAEEGGFWVLRVV
jgi:hypothetical protein